MRRKDLMSWISGLVKFYGPKIAYQGEFSAYDEYDGLRYGDFADGWEYPVLEGHEIAFTDTTLRKNGKEGWLYTYDGIYIKDVLNTKLEIPFAGLECVYADKTRMIDHLSTVTVLYDNGNKVEVDNVSANKEPLEELLEKISSVLRKPISQKAADEKIRLVDYIKKKIDNVFSERCFITFCTDYDRNSKSWTDDFEKRLKSFLSLSLSYFADEEDEEDDDDEYNDDEYDEEDDDDEYNDDDFVKRLKSFLSLSQSYSADEEDEEDDDDEYNDDEEDNARYDEYAEMYRKHLEKIYRSFNGQNILAIIDIPENLSIKRDGIESTGIILTNEELAKYDVSNIPFWGGYMDSSIEYVPYKEIEEVELVDRTKEQGAHGSDFLGIFSSSNSKGPSVMIKKEDGYSINTELHLNDEQTDSIKEVLSWLKDNTGQK